jgi:hypothetical protein
VFAARARSAPSIDGALDDAAWADAVPADTFTQKAPSGGNAPTDRTTLRVIYDNDSIYVAFDCEQSRSPIIARLARRDRPVETDSVSVAFDPRGDGWSAYEFSVSAAGGLVDGVRFDDGKIAREWDAVWEASTRQRADGWSAEIRVPLKLLRFDEANARGWRFQARRYVAAIQETDEWAYIPRNEGGEVSRYGRIANLHVSDAPGAIEAVPFVLARLTHQGADPAIARSSTRFEASAGLDFKWQPSRSFALNGTVNPDFGQVEADRLLLNLSTIEVAFPEKRPFFLANMDEFATLVPIVYSRRIGRSPHTPTLSSGEHLDAYPQPAPIYGALKLAGDLGASSSVAAMSALTGPNEVTVLASGASRQLRLLDPVTSYNVLRARAKLAQGFEVGATGTATLRNEPGFGWPAWVTGRGEYAQTSDASGIERASCPEGERVALVDRCFHDAYVLSADFAWRSQGGDYALRGQGYGSAIANGPARVFADGTRIQSGDIGTGGALRFSKQGGGAVLVDATVAANSRALDFNDLGFMDRQNTLRGGAYLEYRTLEPWSLFRETHTSALAYAENNWSAVSLGRGAMVLEHLVFDSQWTLTVGAYGNLSHYDDREVGDGTALERSGLFGTVQSISTDPAQRWVLSAQLSEEVLSEALNYNGQVGLTWQPFATSELSLLASYTYNAGEPRYAGVGVDAMDLVFGRLDAESAALALRASHAFLPALTLQAYAQAFLARGTYYDYTHFARMQSGSRPLVALQDLAPSVPPAVRPDFERATLALNVVLRWEYRLGSTLYLLYVRSQTPTLTLEPAERPRLDLGRIGRAPASDVVMLKLAYLIE